MILSQKVKDILLGLFGGDPDNQNEVINGLSGVFLQKNNVNSISFNQSQTTAGGLITPVTGPAIIANSDQFANTDTFTFGSSDTTKATQGTTIINYTSGANTATNASAQTGNIWVTSGNVTGASSTANSGFVGVNSGFCAGSGSSGEVVVQSGDNTGTGETASVFVQSGHASNNVSGSANLVTGATNSASASGSISVSTGQNTGSGPSGDVVISTSAGNGNSGQIQLETGDTSVAGKASGAFTVSTGVGQTSSGSISISSGVSGTADSGSIDISTGRMSGTGGASSGPINITTGIVNTGNGSGKTGDVNISSGNATSANPTNSGNINLNPGTATGTQGNIGLFNQEIHISSNLNENSFSPVNYGISADSTNWPLDRVQNGFLLATEDVSDPHDVKTVDIGIITGSNMTGTSAADTGTIWIGSGDNNNGVGSGKSGSIVLKPGNANSAAARGGILLNAAGAFQNPTLNAIRLVGPDIRLDVGAPTVVGNIWSASNTSSTGQWIPAGSVNNVRVATSSPVTVSKTTDSVIVTNLSVAGAVTVNLPSSPTANLTFTIKDGKGDGATHNITVTPAAGTIDGAATSTINTNYGFAKFIYNGTEWNKIG